MFYKTILAAFLFFGVYLGVSFFQLRGQLFEVYNVPANQIIGPEGADLTVVEFALYSCDTCRELQVPFRAAMARDGKVRYIPRPIAFEKDHPGQADFVRVTYAAAKQGKFEETFHYLMDNKFAVLDEVQIAQLSAEAGLDIIKLKEDMNSPDVEAALIENEKFYEMWGFTTVPVFLMGSKAIYRIRSSDEVPTEDEFLEMFEKARSFF
ncbi:MAG: thioredoxin domain-containing protein [Alphaproteobacteria bacterium]|nr:thioredoxin domain-containing protein [Alphaproteobacteria bacterium]